MNKDKTSIAQPTLLLSKLRQPVGNFLFVLPALAIFAVFYIYPFFKTFHLAFLEWDGIVPEQIFVGLDNFKELIGEDQYWWISVKNALYVTFIALTFQNLVALALALLCDREIKLRRFYRMVFFIPPVLSETVVGLIWQWILYAGTQDGQHVGLLNYFLNQTGFHHLVRAWLSEPETALTCIAVVHSWKGFGWGFLLLLAGLQTIDRQLYEAARVDGAGPFSVFKNVTVPMMIPVFMMVIILTILGSMQIFVLVLVMVSQGLGTHTDVPVLRILASMTGGDPRFGYACAMAVIFGILLIIVSFTMRKLSEKVKQA